MITMRDWRVEVPEGESGIGYTGEKLVFRLEIATDAPPDWGYKLDLRYADGSKNYLELNYTGGVLWCDIQRDMLVNGRVRAQVRALLGALEKHSNIFGLYVHESVLAVQAFTASEPSAFAQLEQRLTELKLAAEDAARRAEEAAASCGCGGGGALPEHRVVLDRYEYDGLPAKDPKTLYLIRG